MVFVRPPFYQNTSNRKLNITFNFRFHMYEIFIKSGTSHALGPLCHNALGPPLSQTHTFSDPLHPSSVMYFMDGPVSRVGCSLVTIESRVEKMLREQWNCTTLIRLIDENEVHRRMTDSCNRWQTARRLPPLQLVPCHQVSVGFWLSSEQLVLMGGFDEGAS